MTHGASTRADPLSEEELIVLATQGNHAAYGELYDRYAASVRGVCLGVTGCLETAQDLTQEVFLRGFQKLPSLRDPGRFGPWLIGIARNVNLHWLRQKRRRLTAQVGIPAEALAVEPSPGGDCGALLAGALAKLTEQERMAIVLVYLEGRHADEVKKVLRLSTSGFYKMLGRARANFIKHVERGE